MAGQGWPNPTKYIYIYIFLGGGGGGGMVSVFMKNISKTDQFLLEVFMIKETCNTIGSILIFNLNLDVLNWEKTFLHPSKLTILLCQLHLIQLYHSDDLKTLLAGFLASLSLAGHVRPYPMKSSSLKDVFCLETISDKNPRH